MDPVGNSGRIIFAVAMAFFGLDQLLYAAGLHVPPPGPPWIPGRPLLTFLSGAILLALSVAIATNIRTRWAASLLGIYLFIAILIFYVPPLLANPRNPGKLTSTFELLALGAGSLLLSGAFAARKNQATLAIFRIVFAVSVSVFGIQHLMYGEFVATLVPAWMPLRLFWAYFIGVAFIVAALSIASTIRMRLAATLLGSMFLLFVVMLHIPRVIGALSNGNEWTSAFIAIAMVGASWIVCDVRTARDLTAAPPFRETAPR